MDTYHRWMEVVIYATLTGSPAIGMPVPLADPARTPALGDLTGIQLVGAPHDDLGVLPAAMSASMLDLGLITQDDYDKLKAKALGL